MQTYSNTETNSIPKLTKSETEGADTEETDPKNYPHADTKDIDSAEEYFEIKIHTPNLSE